MVVVGNHPLINGRETEDRTDLALPPAQEELLRAVHAANPRTVLVVQSSYPYAIDWAQEHVPAILWSAHGGQEFGHALADVLFGDVAPAGRLTQTWYSSAADLPDLLDYDIIAADATYLYFRGTPLYPFGHGLTYTTFDYSDLRLSADAVAADGSVEVSVDGDQHRRPGQRRGRAALHPAARGRGSSSRCASCAASGASTWSRGARTTVRFELAAADLATWDVTRGRRVVEAAPHTVMVGRSSTDIRQAAELRVAGETIPPRDALAAPIAAISYDDYAGVDLRDVTPPQGDAVERGRVAAPGSAFGDVDFGPGAGACRARVSAVDDRTAIVTLRLDDPLAGPVIGTFCVPCPGGRYAWVEASTPVEGASGVRDLYAVFGSAGIGLDTLDLRAAMTTVKRGSERTPAHRRGDHHRRRPARRRGAEHGVLCAQRQAGHLGLDPAAGAGQHPHPRLPPARRRAVAGQQPGQRHRAGAAAAVGHAPARPHAVRQLGGHHRPPAPTTTSCW